MCPCCSRSPVHSTVFFRRSACVIFVVVLGSGSTAGTIFAQTVDVIRGRVTGTDSLPLERVAVVVSSISGNVNRTSITDRNGRFTITFPGGDGDYIVSMTIIGYSSKRFEIKRAADEDFLIADARLSKIGAVLDAVKVTAARDKVTRGEAQADISGTERPVQNSALPPSSIGDIAAMAASLPGVQLVPGQDGSMNGFSVLGLGADQNNTTLNGLAFGGDGFPRDAQIMSSLVTSPYDVSRGGFSGGQFRLQTRPGTNFIGRGLSTVLDAPQLQWADRAATSLGQKYSNASLGGAVSGPVIFDKAFYNVAFQLGRRGNDLQTLLNTDPVGLQASGVSADSATRLVSLLQSARIPTAYGALPGSRLADQGSLIGAVDFTPPTSSSGTAYNLTFSGSWNKQNPATSLTTSLPTTSGERTSLNGGVQGRHSSYFSLRSLGVLTESTVGVSASSSVGTPYVDLPSGRVRVNSTFADGTNGVQTLAFGGSAILDASQRTNSINAVNTMSWFSGNNKHRLKLATELRRDGNTQDQTTNRLGTFSYNSLAELQAGVPVSFVRSLVPRTRDASIAVGAISLGDSWRRTTNLQFQYGVRVDANRFLDTPTRNSELERLLGVRNDRAPNGVFVSPRLGVSWAYGTAAQIGAFQGAFRGPRAVLRGGIGLFQNTPGATLIGPAIDNTGLASAVQQLVCVGPATPLPNWTTYIDPLRIPSVCADGSSGTVFANAAPNVTLFAKGFRSPSSARSNLSWTGAVLSNRLNASVDGTFSYNMHQSSFIDRNFAPTTRFALADEGQRPVYVQRASIIPFTGAIAAGDARVVTQYNRVTEQLSDLHSTSRQLSFRLSPLTFSSSFTWSASYTYSNVREQFRGFSSTVSNPLNVEWGRSGFDSRHQLVYSLNYNAFDLIRFNWSGQFRSGTPFTPTVIGDINGDGFSNDRAFVFNPTAATDPTLAAGMRTLLDNGSTAAKDCLSRQLGALARRNSCQGPWATTANLSISFNPLKVRMPQRATLSFNITNPLGAADLVLHGENKLHGWGQTPFADPSLLYVRGFDPVNGRYTYEVNQRFGSTNPTFSPFRNPVSITASLRYDIGPTRERQILTQSLDRGRNHTGVKAPEQLIKAQFGNGGVQNPMATLLRDQDTLKLSATQADSLATMNRRYTIFLDSVWTPVARDFAKLPDAYSRGAAYDRYQRAREASIDRLIALAPVIKGLLTAEQFRRVPSFVASTLDKRYLVSIRSGTAGSGSAGPFQMGGFGGGAQLGGGAGAATFIAR